MKKIYCKQIPPEYQQDDLFFTGENKQGKRTIGWNTDKNYANNVVIYGNSDYLPYYTEAYDKVSRNIDDASYEYENRLNHWKNFSEIINYYFTKENGKKYSKKEIHKWKNLMDYWQDSEGDYLEALELITGKKWRQVCIKGCCQNEWQYLYVSEEITQEDIDYIEMCYFNNGSEWRIFESKKDMNNGDCAYSVYVDSYNVKENLAKRIGCKEEQLVIYEFDSWERTANYKQI